MKTSILRTTLLSLIIVFGGCKNENNKTTQSSAPSQPKNFEHVYPPAVMTNPQERANFLVTHFWEHFNFKDTMYAHTPDITEQAFVDFISFFKQANPDKIREGVANLMKAAETDSVMFAYFAREAGHYLYEPNSPFRNDEYYIPFLEQIVNSKNLDDAQKIRPQYLLNLALKNRPGNKAEDVVYTLASGKTGTLYSIKAQYVLLMFYNPGCHECQNTMEMIKNSAEIAPLIKSGTIKTLTIYPDEKLDEWEKHSAEIPSNWINGYDKALNIRNKEIYDIKAIPTLYLLDKDKKVLLKDCSIADINDFVKTIQDK
jgi:thioredoxin-related protein